MEKNIVHYQCNITAENLTLEILIEKNDSSSTSNKSLNIISNHVHPYLEIFVCTKDTIQIRNPSGIITVHAGEAAIIPPFISHCCLNQHANDAWLALSFFIRKQPMLECYDLYSLCEPFIINNKILVVNQVPELFATIHELTENCNSSNRVVPSLQFLYQLCRISSDNKLCDNIEQAVESTKDSNLIRMNLLDRIINNGFMHPINAEEVAKELHLSTRQLDRIVKQRYNKTLYQVIMDRRLTTAAALLRSSDMSAERIAVTVGFTSKNNFWTKFQKKFNMTPAEYRKNDTADNQVTENVTADKTASF